MNFLRKNALLLLILIGASLSDSYATDGNPANQSDAAMIKAQSRAYVESLYNDSVVKDKDLIAFKKQLETAKNNLQAAQDHFGKFQDNPKLQAQLVHHQTAFNAAQEQYTAHSKALLVKFYESCATLEADLAFDYAIGMLERQDPLPILGSDNMLHLMKSYPIVKSLHRVNKAFCALAHHPDLAHKFKQHIFEPCKIKDISFPGVSFRFKKLPCHLSIPECVCEVDISATNIGLPVDIEQLSKFPHIFFDLGSTDSHGYHNRLKEWMDFPGSNERWTFCSFILKSPKFPQRCKVGKYLSNPWCPIEVRDLGISTLNTIMHSEKTPDCFEAAQQICSDSNRKFFSADDISFAYDLLSKNIADPENLACGIFALSLAYSPIEQHQSSAFSVLRNKIMDHNGANRDAYASALLHSKDEQNYTLALPFFRAVLPDKENKGRFSQAEQFLCFCERENTKLFKAYLLLTELLPREVALYCIQFFPQFWETQSDESLALSVIEDTYLQSENSSSALDLLISHNKLVSRVLYHPQGIEQKATLLQTLVKEPSINPHDRAQLKRAATTIFNDPQCDAMKFRNLSMWMKPKDISRDTCLRLLDSSKPFPLTYYCLLSCAYPDIKERAEDQFIQECTKEKGLSTTLNDWVLRCLVNELSENKKPLWVEKACDLLQSPTLTDDKKFSLACLVVTLSDQPQFIELAQAAIGNRLKDIGNRYTDSHPRTIDNGLHPFFMVDMPHMLKMTPAFLNHLSDDDLKSQIVKALFKDGTSKSLVMLLTQNDASIRKRALPCFEKLIVSAQNETTRTNRFGSFGLALSKIETEQDRVSQIYKWLVPQFKSILASAEENISGFSDPLKFFLVVGDQTQKTAVYNRCCEVINKTAFEAVINGAGEVITSTLGVDHPWSQAITTLMEERKNSLGDYLVVDYKHEGNS